jgi:large subunit ribosomal protein L32
MPVPKRKRSRSRRDKRFANKGMVMHTITACASCQRPLLPHSACSTCGFYKGAKVINTKIDRKVNRLNTRHVKQASRTRTSATEQPTDSTE